MVGSRFLWPIAFCALAQTAGAQSPLSAIDWLGQTPTVTLGVNPFVPLNEPPVAQSVTTPEVSVTPLEDAGRDAVGLLPSSVTGLPSSLWQESDARKLKGLLEQVQTDSLPAMQALLYTLLLAEANPPQASGQDDKLLLARVDKLVSLGAIEQANALLDRAGPDSIELFQRWFDVTLLIGEEDRACGALLANPSIAPSYAARVFCLARTGDWSAAVVTLETAKLLNLVSPLEDALLLRFLDPEIASNEPLLTAAAAMTPLNYRLFEAIGEPQPTGSLPRAYAHGDIRSTAGWKAQLEAAERLARAGALPENRLLGIYTARKAAASGMIWDRVDALQRFDDAVLAKDARAVSNSLPAAWSAMQKTQLEVPFARLYGPSLVTMPLQGVSAELARRIALLSPDYETVARAIGSSDFLAGLAKGEPPRKGISLKQNAIANAFHGAGVPQNLTHRLARGQLGEVILESMHLFGQGVAGDLPALTQSLATFRAVGLEDTARQAALQVLLLERSG